MGIGMGVDRHGNEGVKYITYFFHRHADFHQDPNW